MRLRRRPSPRREFDGSPASAHTIAAPCAPDQQRSRGDGRHQHVAAAAIAAECAIGDRAHEAAGRADRHPPRRPAPRWGDDLYHRALTITWPRFLGLPALVYLAVNSVFALLYLAAARLGRRTRARVRSWTRSSSASRHSARSATACSSPATRYANSVMTVETLCGIMLVALDHRLDVRARIAPDSARAVRQNGGGEPARRRADADGAAWETSARARSCRPRSAMTLVRNERTREGEFMRRFHDLKLERGRTPVFAMSFLAMHRLDEMSPLSGASPESARRIRGRDPGHRHRPRRDDGAIGPRALLVSAARGHVRLPLSPTCSALPRTASGRSTTGGSIQWRGC